MARFQSVDSDLMALSRELERMGGGSAATITGSFYVRCRAAEYGPAIVSFQGDSVLLSNPQNPDQRGNKTFSCDGSFPASSTQAQVSETMALSITSQLLKGFNCLVLSIGETGSGKSHTLFGNPSSGSGGKGEGVAHSVIDALLKTAAADAGVAVDMAACEIGADACTDLFGNEPLEVSHFSSALSIGISSTQDSRLLVRQALQKSRNACVNPSGQLLELAPNRSHLCMRIRFKTQGRVSQVWIVDTVGSRPLAGARNSVRHFTSSPDVDREQRALSQQLFGLNKLLTEMSAVSHGTRTLESARSSNLSFFVSSLITDNHSLVCVGTVQSEASHHLDSYNTLRISSAARSIIVPCKHTKSADEPSFIPAAQFLLHASSSKAAENQKLPARSPHTLPSSKNAPSRPTGTPSVPRPRADGYGLSTSPTHVIELGSSTHDAHFRAASEADAFEISEDSSSVVLSPLSGHFADDQANTRARVHHEGDRQHVAPKPQLSVFQPHAFSVDNDASMSRQGPPVLDVDEGYSDASDGNQSDDGVFFASKIIDDHAAAGSAQVGGWSTFLEENMSSSAASEADNASVSDACGEMGHDSSSLKIAFQDTLAKVSPTLAKSGLAVAAVGNVNHETPLNEEHQTSRSTDFSNSGDRFYQQQPLLHTSASRLPHPPSVPAASAISLIPVTVSSPASESFDSPGVAQESAQVKQAVVSLAAAASLPSSIPFAIPPSLPPRFQDAHSHNGPLASPGTLPQDLLMRNHESLLSMLRSGENQVLDLQERLRLCELELSEARMKQELQEEGARQEVLELRSKLRLAERESTASELFDRYEMEISALSASLSRSEDELISLKCLSSETANSSDSALAMMRRTVRQQQREMDRLRRDNEDMKKHQRAALSSKKLMDDMSKKISQLNKIIAQKEEAVSVKGQQIMEYEDLIRLQHKELQHTKSSEMELVSRCAALSENVSELQRQVAELNSSRRSARNIPALAPSSPSIAGMLRNSAADMCNKLERDCGASNPRCHTWIIKLREIIEKYERDRAINEEQKQEMLASLIEFQRKQGKPSSSLSERNN